MLNMQPINRGMQRLLTGLSTLGKSLRFVTDYLQQAAVDWYRQDFPLIGYLFKYLLAAFLALWVALKMEMDQPATALLTVVIVMHFRSGMVITKSYYRLIGTVIGLLVGYYIVYFAGLLVHHRRYQQSRPAAGA